MLQSEVNDSFLRSVRDGNLDLVLEHLDYAGVNVATSNAVSITLRHVSLHRENLSIYFCSVSVKYKPISIKTFYACLQINT